MPSDAEHPDDIDADDTFLDRVGDGQPPAGDPVAEALARWRDEVRRPISGWVPDSTAPSGWSWHPDLTAIEATSALPAVTGRVEYGGAVNITNPRPADYVYTDPTTDDAWPRIAEVTDDDTPDAFPPGWGGAPTERDQAAIDAGNA